MLINIFDQLSIHYVILFSAVFLISDLNWYNIVKSLKAHKYMDKWIWWQWTLFILGILLGIYVLYFFFVLGFSLSFKRKINKKQISINLLLTQRHDILNLIYRYFVESNVKVPLPISSYLDEAINYETVNLDDSVRNELLNRLNKASQGLLYLADEFQNIKTSSKYLDYCQTLSDLDVSYRQLVAKYNSDIAGYNYWVHSFGYRGIFKLLRLKQKKIIV